MIHTICYDFKKADEQPLERRGDMTIIIAMKETDDSLLIGADTMTTEDGDMKAEMPTKLFKHGSHNIVWGASGNKEISAHEFSPWLQSLNIEGDWEWLKLKIADKIAKLNGRQRKRVKKAGLTAPPESLMSCLLVGWVNGESQIYEFTNDGRIESYKSVGFRAIGSGDAIAYGAYGVMRRTKELPETKLKIILDTTVKLDIHCGKPVRMKRVTKDKVEDFT